MGLVILGVASSYEYSLNKERNEKNNDYNSEYVNSIHYTDSLSDISVGVY